MKKLFRIVFLFLGTLILFSTAYSSNTTFLGPTARVGYTSTLNDNTAYNFAGEAGVKNFRLSGTLGWKFCENQLFKLSAEYLWQDISYSFFVGNSNKWVEQGAIGAAYQYDLLNFPYQPQLDLSAYASHAPNKSLSTVTGTFNNSQGNNVNFTDVRRIAGSNAYGAAPGIAIMAWQGGRVSAALNYDWVSYDTKYRSNEDAKGFGGTIGLNQAISDNLGLGLAAAWRQPFDNYAAKLSWNNMYFYGMWSLGLFADYTHGKNTLPNTWNLGLSADYFLDRRCQVAPANLKGEAIMQPAHDNLLPWTADPAVYMPQVLAIVDERVTTDSCANQTVSTTSPFPDLAIPFTGPLTTTVIVDATPHFSGPGLTYSVSTSGTIGASTVSITPGGTLTINAVHPIGAPQTFTVNVTVSNGCGTASSSFSVTVDPLTG